MDGNSQSRKKTLKTLIGLLNGCKQEYATYIDNIELLALLNSKHEVKRDPDSNLMSTEEEILQEHYGDVGDKIVLQIIKLVDELGGAGVYTHKKVTVKIDYRVDLKSYDQTKLMQIIFDNEDLYSGIKGIKIIIMLDKDVLEPFFAMVHHVCWYEKLFNEE